MAGSAPSIREDPLGVGFVLGGIGTALTAIGVLAVGILGGPVLDLLRLNLTLAIGSLALIALSMARDPAEEENIIGSLVGALLIFVVYLAIAAGVAVAAKLFGLFAIPLSIFVDFLPIAAAVFVGEAVLYPVLVGLWWGGTWVLGIVAPSGTGTRSTTRATPATSGSDGGGESEGDRLADDDPQGSGIETGVEGANASHTASPSPADESPNLPESVERAVETAADATECAGFERLEGPRGYHRFRARSDDVERQVEIVVAGREFDEDQFESGVETALRTWANVSTHPNVVPVYEWSLDPVPWVVVDATAGTGTLRDLRTDLSPAEVLATIDRTCEAVHTAHRYNQHHGSLDPGRVLLGPEKDRGAVSVDGWGFYRVLDRAAHRDGVGEFTPPEQVETPATSGPATDVYRLAATAYWALTGEPPVRSDRPPERAITEGDRIAPTEREESLPPALDDALLTSLSIEPENRHDSAFEFKQAVLRASEPLR